MKLTPTQREALLKTLGSRFMKHPERHKGVKWAAVESALAKAKDPVWASLWQMEETGGEPDVVTFKKEKGIAFVDCAQQSPKGRRSCCYDKAARTGRKEHPPKTSAEEMAKEMGVELLTEEQYRALQEVGEFDTTTSSWIATPKAVRTHGGALFGDYRYKHTFIYHNGADSYYAARGWRGVVRV